MTRDTGWDDEADVVILGCGGAGAVAAITASDAGAKVIVVEKGDGGGNTRLATMPSCVQRIIRPQGNTSRLSPLGC